MPSSTAVKRETVSGPIFRPVAETLTVRKRVAEQIRAAIFELRLLPGDRLIERELCEQMSVSRSVVREALAELEAVGLVETIPFRGPMVARVDAETARDVYTIRAELEALAGRLCAEYATAADLVALRKALQIVENAYTAGNTANWLPAKQYFYETLLAAGGNAALGPMLRAIHGRITILRAMTLAEPGRTKTSVRELRAIVRAVEARDPDRAATACRDHVTSAAATALRALER